MMAVPFFIPEDEVSNLIAAVIFVLSQTRFQRNRENRELQECMEELVRLLTEEIRRRARHSEYDHRLKQTLLLLRQSLNQLTPTSAGIPRRSIFESCCDDCKISLHEDCPTEDCSQVGLMRRKIADEDTAAICKEERLEEKEEYLGEQRSFFSRLVPGVRRTFWTAVPLICMVGWHLFQTSYSL